MNLLLWRFQMVSLLSRLVHNNPVVLKLILFAKRRSKAIMIPLTTETEQHHVLVRLLNTHATPIYIEFIVLHLADR